ncbi:metallophosphoesterase [candidate division KSB1 bacterium]
MNPLIKYLIFYSFHWWMSAFFFFFLFYLIFSLFSLTAKAAYLIVKRTLKPKRNEVSLRKAKISFYATVLPILFIFILIASGFYVSEGKLSVTENRMYFKTLPEKFSGFKIIHITDIHCDIFTGSRKLKRIVEITNELNPDLILLTGDYVSNSVDYVRPMVEEFINLKSKFGIYATLGNHDFWTDPGIIESVLESGGINVLKNESVKVNIDEDHIYIAGINDLHNNPNFTKSLEGVETGAFKILLSHNPNTFDLAAAFNIPLTLSGHTHGGQLVLNIFGRPLSISRLATRYVSGTFKNMDSILYVNKGIGYTGPPIRVNASAEIALFTLYNISEKE